MHKGDRRYVMEVVNEVQRQTIEEWSTTLVPWLRDRLSNDRITLAAEVKEGEAPLHVLNDRELLSTLMEEDAALRNFINTLGLKLS